MLKVILFSLEHCVKCQQTKELLGDRPDIEIVTFPHDLAEWSGDQKILAEEFDVFKELQRTAPILWVNGKKEVGYLRIRKWLQDNPA